MRTLVTLVRRHPLAAFFTLTYAWSWTLWTAFGGLYSSGHVVGLPLLMLGMFGPGLASIGVAAVIATGEPHQHGGRTAFYVLLAGTAAGAMLVSLDQVLNERRAFTPALAVACLAAGVIPAFVLASAFSSSAAIRRHLSTLLHPRGARVYYALAVGMFATLWLAGIPLSRALGFPVPARTYPPAAASVGIGAAVVLEFLYNLLPNGLSEEIGWRGFALPRLQARHSPLAASLILWVFWALWHAPAYFGGFAAQGLEDTLVEWTFMMPVTIVFTWFYNRAAQSVLVTVLLHPAMNTATHFLPITLGGALLLLGLVVWMVIADRMWRAPRPAIPAVEFAG